MSLRTRLILKLAENINPVDVDDGEDNLPEDNNSTTDVDELEESEFNNLSKERPGYVEVDPDELLMNINNNNYVLQPPVDTKCRDLTEFQDIQPALINHEDSSFTVPNLTLNNDLEDQNFAEQQNDIAAEVGLENEAENENQALEEITNNTKVYPLKTTPGRRRIRNEKCWKSTISKENRNLGKEYVSRNSKKVVKAREVKGSCKEKKCKLCCYEKISEEQRHHIFKKFWSFGDHNRHYDFLAKHVKVSEKKVCTVGSKPSRRQNTLLYFFTIDKSVIKVCKTFFLNTLDINDMWVRTTLSKLSNSGVGVGSPDNRGRTPNSGKGKLPVKVIESIRKHINSFPRMESHYIRKDFAKEYLQTDVQSVGQMYRLYLQDNKDKRPVATLRQYREVFNLDFNIGFFLPKKDQCDICDNYSIATEDEIREKNLTKMIEMHKKNKEKVRTLKEADKLRATKDEQLMVACFDLQKVLITPYKDVSIFYYKLKYSTYNFTIFDIGKKKGHCYIWHETLAKRGANEIGSCVLKFIEEQCALGIREFIFYSDNCAGQNRNRFVFAMYLYAASKFRCSITHRFMEKGHTQSEGDSMHALIEKKKKGQVIYTPQQWVMLIRAAKTTEPRYSVHEMSQTEIYNLKSLVEMSKTEWLKSESGEIIKWTEIREIKVEEGKINIKYDFFSDETKILSFKKENSRKRKSDNPKTLSPAYTSLLPISLKKYQHLQYLCKHAVPEMYHEFYKNLPHVAATRASTSNTLESDEEL